MRLTKKQELLNRCVGFCIALISATTQAAGIDFEDVLPSSVIDPCFESAPVGCTLSALDSTTYRFTAPDNGFSNHAHLVSSPYELPYVNLGYSYASNGTQYIGLDATLLVMQRINGGAFSASRFDAAEGWIHGGNLEYNATQLRVDGSVVGGGVVTAIFDFDGINDGTGPLADFQTFALPSTFINLSSLNFQSLTAAGVLGNVIFSVDNIAAAAVPEPTSLTLMLAGMGIIFICYTIRGKTLDSSGSRPDMSVA